MKKLVKTIILLPMWPLIWLKLGVRIDGNCWDDCACSFGCCGRAKKMVRWWKR